MDMKHFLVSALMVLLNLSYTAAQNLERLDIPFHQNGSTLRMPQCGGLNNPQYSSAHLNTDETPDLYVFDYAAKKHLAFTWQNGNWMWEEKLTTHFPELESWAFLHDFNQDGAADIFAYAFDGNTPGLIVYEGYWENDLLHFERYLFSEFQFAQAVYTTEEYYGNIYITAGEIPAIGDVDNDGDIDILTYGASPGYLDFYQNQSVEAGFGVDTLLFDLQHNCWGGIYESGNGIVLSEVAGECASGLGNEKVHGNSTLSLLDYDNNGLQDLLVSDLSTPFVSLLLNNGTNDTAHISELQSNFPAYDRPFEIQYTPYLSILDVDMDGKKDVLASPQLFNSENIHVTHFYKNIGEERMRFAFQETQFLGKDMIDFGAATHPAIADVNGDGLLDLVVGNYGYFTGGGGRDGRLILCLNVGTTTEPAFELTDDDWLGISASEHWLFTPTFADLDTDGDLDLVFGTAIGIFFYAENMAAAGEAMDFQTIEEHWMNLHSVDFPIGQRSTPHFTDVDGDGLLDLLTGEYSGNVNYFKNIGTAENPAFNPDAFALENNNFWGELDARTIGSLQGNSAPYVLPTKAESVVLLATEAGGVQQYTNLDTEAFVQAEQALLSAQYGHNLQLAAADLNSDGYIDIVTGHERGGLSFFTTSWQVAPDSTMTNLDKTLPSEDFKAYTSNGQIHIQNLTQQPYQFVIYDVHGRIIVQQNRATTSKAISTIGWPQAVYILSIFHEQTRGHFKLFVE